MTVENRKELVENNKVYISCIVPVYNEALIIKDFLKTLHAKLRTLTSHFEIIIIDDGSTDDSIFEIQSIAKELDSLKILGLSRNFGKEIALTAGLEHCNGDIAILMDADFQHPLSLLATFLAYWSDGYDMVYGVRNHRKNETYFKKTFALGFYWLMNKITKIDLPDNAGDFRLFDKNIVNVLKLFPERTRFMKGLYAWVGYKKISVPYDVQDRAGGESSWGFIKLAELAITGITSFSDVPLRIWGLIGFGISFISFIYAIYIVTVTLLFGADLPGFPTVVVAIMFLGGIQLLSIGILGEYIARIFTEVKQRPLYLINIKQGFDDKPNL